MKEMHPSIGRGVRLVTGLALAVAVTAAATPASRRSVSYAIRTMGTYGQIIVVTADSAASESDADRALAAFVRVDSLMSNWTTTSEVARLNRVAANGPTAVEPEVATVLGAALDTWRGSNGAFDV